jgi:hypothetical protein
VKHLLWFACLLAAGWLALGGVVSLILHNGVMEVVSLELAGLTLAIVGVGVLVDDVLGPR